MEQINFFIGLISVTVILVSLVLFFIFLMGKEQQRKQQTWEQLNLLAEVTAQEKEKARITYQLHEDFGATLSVIKMYMGNFTLHQEHEKEQRETAKQHINDMIIQIRGIALEYLPYALQQSKLDDVLQQYIDVVNEEYADLITLEIAGTLPPISRYKAVSIYRIVQEIISNTLQHANATRLLITVTFKQDNLLLMTRDNGIGFDYPKALEEAKGLGLNTILTRVKLLKSTLEVDAARGGTLFLMEIPL